MWLLSYACHLYYNIGTRRYLVATDANSTLTYTDCENDATTWPGKHYTCTPVKVCNRVLKCSTCISYMVLLPTNIQLKWPVYIFLNNLFQCIHVHLCNTIAGTRVFRECPYRVYCDITVEFRRSWVQIPAFPELFFFLFPSLLNCLFTIMYVGGFPSDGTPIVLITTFFTPLYIIYNIAVLIGIAFAVVCLLFNCIFRNR